MVNCLSNVQSWILCNYITCFLVSSVAGSVDQSIAVVASCPALELHAAQARAPWRFALAACSSSIARKWTNSSMERKTAMAGSCEAESYMVALHSVGRTEHKTASRPLHCFCQYPKWYAAQQALRSARSSPKNKIMPDWPESKDTSLYTSNMCPLPRWMHCIHGTPMVQVNGTR